LEETKNDGEPLHTNGNIAEEDDQGENGVDYLLPQYVRNLFLDKQMRKFKKFVKEMDF
jgi:hypothetical protein